MFLRLIDVDTVATSPEHHPKERKAMRERPLQPPGGPVLVDLQLREGWDFDDLMTHCEVDAAFAAEDDQSSVSGEESCGRWF